MPTNGLVTTMTVVRDMDAAQHFYEHVLGTAVAFRDRAEWCQFALGAGRFSLSSPAEAGDGAAGSLVVFATDDLDGFAGRVRAVGGTCLERRDMGDHGTVATFADPEGNLFKALSRPRPPAAAPTAG